MLFAAPASRRLNHPRRAHRAAPVEKPHYDLVVMVASAEGIRALSDVLGALPEDFPAPVALVQHGSPTVRSVLAAILAHATRLEVREVVATEPLRAGVVYIAPAHRQLLIGKDHQLHLIEGERFRHPTSANSLLESAAIQMNGRVVAVLIAGADSDGLEGVAAVRAAGGLIIVQEHATSQVFRIPQSTIESSAVDYVLPLERIGPALVGLVGTGAIPW